MTRPLIGQNFRNARSRCIKIWIGLIRYVRADLLLPSFKKRQHSFQFPGVFLAQILCFTNVVVEVVKLQFAIFEILMQFPLSLTRDAAGS